jgi:hypothetical protein
MCTWLVWFGLYALSGTRALAEGLREPEPRWCCALGERPPLSVTPEATRPLALDVLLEHEYGGTGYLGVVENVALRFAETVRSVAPRFPRQAVSRDPVGYVYTARGGIIDIGHVRGTTDRAIYFAEKFDEHLRSGVPFAVYPEKGSRRVVIRRRIASPSDELCAALGARLAWETAVWHEIETFFTWEQYSAFSPEDLYSNLLGAHVGMTAYLADGDTNDAVDEALGDALVDLGAMPPSVMASVMRYLDGVWFRTNPGLDLDLLPARWADFHPALLTFPLRSTVQLELLKRNFDVEGALVPWLATHAVVPDRMDDLRSLRSEVGWPTSPEILEVPTHGPSGETLVSYYRLETEPDGTIPRSFLAGTGAPLTSERFPDLVARIRDATVAVYPRGDQP